MKKILYLLPLVLVCCVFGACKQDVSVYLKSHISEKCCNYYVGETNDFFINFFSGEREKDYKLDGFCGDVVPYSILSVKSKNGQSFDELQYVVEIGEKTFEGALVANPYDNNLEADLEVFVETGTEVFVYLKFADVTQVANLECIFNNFSINLDTALDIAVDELVSKKPQLDVSLNYECFVQILNKDNNAKMYFWFVNIVSSNGDAYNIIIDTTTGQILAEKL